MRTGDETSLWPAAREAAAMVESGMVVGLGTGRAAAQFVKALSRRMEEGLEIMGVPTSKQTAKLAEELSIPLATFDEIDGIDIDVDGADEVDPGLDLIKGHGGALLRERVVASVSKRFVVLVGEEKLVPRLGSRVSVPVEVVPFAAPVVRRSLEKLGCEVHLRTNGDGGEPFVSDNGNHILDARFDGIARPGDLQRQIDSLPGVADTGLFIGMAHLVLVQAKEGFRRLERG
jgi:ribose 5-phosphate isomerase A